MHVLYFDSVKSFDLTGRLGSSLTFHRVRRVKLAHIFERAAVEGF